VGYDTEFVVCATPLKPSARQCRRSHDLNSQEHGVVAPFELLAMTDNEGQAATRRDWMRSATR